MTGLCTELANGQKPREIRQQAGLALKNTVVSKDEQKRQELSHRWKMLDENVRRGIREVLLGTLADPVKDIRSTAALVRDSDVVSHFTCRCAALLARVVSLHHHITHYSASNTNLAHCVHTQF